MDFFDRTKQITDELGLDLTVVSTRHPRYRTGRVVLARKIAPDYDMLWALKGDIIAVAREIKEYRDGNETKPYTIKWCFRQHPNDVGKPKKVYRTSKHYEWELMPDGVDEEEFEAQASAAMQTTLWWQDKKG